MTKISVIKQQAIQAAKNSNWPEAIKLNTEILSQDPNDLAALNRLGLAYVQTNELNQAKNSFLAVLKLDKTNNIAKRNLNRIDNKQKPCVDSFKNNDFIEEPGKAKIVQLHRLASKATLNSLSVGKTCILVSKNRYISVETENKTYIGALPEDISFRLAKLIKDGNTYICTIHSCTEKYCCVHIKEEKRSKKNSNINSFPINKNGYNCKNLNDDIFIEEDIPVQLVVDKTHPEDNLEEKIQEMTS